MLIEADARRFISEAIDMERELILMEVREKARGKMVIENEEYRSIRKKLVLLVNQINTVANTEGKGRDDLDESILSSAESVCRK